MITKDLLDSYKKTHFSVNGPTGTFILRTDCYSAELEASHKRNYVRTSAYITAHNPASEPQTDIWNSDAQKAMEAEVAASGFKTVPGSGIDPNNEWPAEPSILILGIDKDDALDLGKRFGQNALLFSASDAIPTLIFPTLPQ